MALVVRLKPKQPQFEKGGLTNKTPFHGCFWDTFCIFASGDLVEIPAKLLKFNCLLPFMMGAI